MIFKNQNYLNRQIIVSVFFIALLILGFNIYPHFGNSIDEKNNRDRGLATVIYIGDTLNINLINNDPGLQQYKNLPKLPVYTDGNQNGSAEHGPFFEIIAVSLERLLNIGGYENNLFEIFQFRHLLNFIFFIFGVYAIFRISERRFDSWYIGLITASFYVLSPRMFADSFHNSNDIVFASLFLLATNSTIGFLINPNLKKATICAALGALAIDLRITGVLLVPLTIGILFLLAFKKELPWITFLKASLVYLTTVILVMILFWPWLWENPVANFLRAWLFLSRVSNYAELTYFGKIITFSPWHYSLVWIGISTPLIYLFFWLIGLCSALLSLIKRRFQFWANNAELQDLIFLYLFFAPIVSVIALGSLLYDGWRHLYFIYPFLLLIATKGLCIVLRFIKKYRIVHTLFIAGLISALGYILYWMILSHPFQNVYFNQLINKNWINRFDVDYHSLTNQRSLYKIIDSQIISLDSHSLTNDYQLCNAHQKTIIKVYDYGHWNNLPLNIALLNPKYRKFLEAVSRPEDADYLITNYRINLANPIPEKYPFSILDHIKINGEIINSTYKRTALNLNFVLTEDAGDLKAWCKIR